MQLPESDGRKIIVDGQTLVVPTPQAWERLWREPFLDGLPLPVPDLLERKVAINQQHQELISALGVAFNRLHFYELLVVGSEFYRVFIEAVVCDNCRYRATLSATPGVMEIYWGASDERAARERSYSLPRLSCHKCGQLFERRRTVWQVNAEA